jgi:uroporphyrin-III C-methyltransferase/precorrin-2 dehydrogenase/sirohydrochlorin ferrochelatase/uroporphyrin-III C-methyltransferase
MSTPAHTGLVILAGAGPGHPELITLQLERHLQQATVIITDRLVNPQIIEAHASPSAKIIYAGKQGYNDTSVPQSSINEIIIREAQAGEYVIRLKGGDTAFFSNILDELEVLVQHNIRYEIVPGITAASGASAFAGIPLTARGHARGVRFLLSDEQQDNNWNELATTADTLVFYMSVARLPQLLQQLRTAQPATRKSVAIVEQATTAQQRVHVGQLADAPEQWLPDDLRTPALVIIGSVAALHQSFAWFAPAAADLTIFRPLTEVLNE